jgi:pimeloyl-ACP methyl ester carboxylesterase
VQCTAVPAACLAASVIAACAQLHGRSYLTASEIDRFIIGKGLTDATADEWKESFLPGDADSRSGRIWGRSRYGLPYARTWSMEADRLCVDYGEGKDCYFLAREGGNRVLGFDGAGALAFESTLVEADRPERAAPANHLPITTETVTFRNREDTLVGDLSLPTGTAPHPTILFVHGSGEPSRHSPFYRPLRDEFLRRGFATLIWSRPGVDESTGDHLRYSMDQRAGEVESAIDMLAARADVDPGRIGLWGISQAGWVVPKVAARREIAFMILVSCSARGVIGQTLYATENVLELLELRGSERTEAIDYERAYFELIRASGTYEEFLSGQERLLAEAKQRSWYARLARPPVAPEASFLGPELPPYLRLLNIDRL